MNKTTKMAIVLSSALLFSTNVMAQQENPLTKAEIEQIIEDRLTKERVLVKAEIEKIVQDRLAEIKTQESNIKTSLNEILIIIASAKNLYGSRETYEGLSNEILLKSGSVPPQMQTSNSFTTNQIRNVFNGTLEITSSIFKKRPLLIQLTYSGVPEYACQSIFQNIKESVYKIEFVNSQGKNKVTLHDYLNEDKKEKLEPSEPIIQCDKENNTFIFTTL